MPGIPPVLGAGVGLPGTPQENVIRQRAQAEKMKKFERESMAEGLVEDPGASTFSEEFYNASEFGFDPPPDNLPYSGSPGKDFAPPVGRIGPVQPGAVNPSWGGFMYPDNHPLFNPHRTSPTPPVAGSWDDFTGEPHADPRHDARLENWKRHQRERERRGEYHPPPVPGGFRPLPFKVPLPATKVYSKPHGPMFGPPPQPPG